LAIEDPGEAGVLGQKKKKERRGIKKARCKVHI